jgi:hypothetical protein
VQQSKAKTRSAEVTREAVEKHMFGPLVGVQRKRTIGGRKTSGYTAERPESRQWLFNVCRRDLDIGPGGIQLPAAIVGPPFASAIISFLESDPN